MVKRSFLGVEASHSRRGYRPNSRRVISAMFEWERQGRKVMDSIDIFQRGALLQRTQNARDGHAKLDWKSTSKERPCSQPAWENGPTHNSAPFFEEQTTQHVDGSQAVHETLLFDAMPHGKKEHCDEDQHSDRKEASQDHARATKDDKHEPLPRNTLCRFTKRHGGQQGTSAAIKQRPTQIWGGVPLSMQGARRHRASTGFFFCQEAMPWKSQMRPRTRLSLVSVKHF